MKWKSKVDNVVRTHHNGRLKFLKGWFLRRFSFHWSCGSKFFGLEVFLDVFGPCGLSLGDQQILLENKASHATSWALLFGNLRHLSAWGGPRSFPSGSGQSWSSLAPTSNLLRVNFQSALMPLHLQSPPHYIAVRFSALCPHILGQNWQNHIFSICAILANPKLLTVKSPIFGQTNCSHINPRLIILFPMNKVPFSLQWLAKADPSRLEPLLDKLNRWLIYCFLHPHSFI